MKSQNEKGSLNLKCTSVLKFLTYLFNNQIKVHHHLLLEEPWPHVLIDNERYPSADSLPAPNPASSMVRRHRGMDVSNHRK